METKAISKVAKNLGGVISKNSPTILTVLGVGGVFTTSMLASRATLKASAILRDEKQFREERMINGKYEPITKRDVVELCWECYIPAVGVGVATVACIIGANSVSLRRNAALASLYTISETAFKEYQSKVIETMGRNKELKLRDEISSDRIQANPPSINEVIFTGKGEILCYDSLSGRYFKHDIEGVRRAINAVNKDFMDEGWISLNTLYYALGLSDTKLGRDMGWDVNRDGLVDIQFSSQLTENNEPCLVLNFAVMPRYF